MKNRDIMNDLLPEDDFFIADAAPDAAKATKMKKKYLRPYRRCRRLPCAYLRHRRVDICRSR